MPLRLVSGFVFPSVLKDDFQTLTHFSLSTCLSIGITWLFLSLRLKASQIIHLPISSLYKYHPLSERASHEKAYNIRFHLNEKSKVGKYIETENQRLLGLSGGGG